MRAIKHWNILPTKVCEISFCRDTQAWLSKTFSTDAALKLDLLWADGWASWPLAVPPNQHFFHDSSGFEHSSTPRCSQRYIAGSEIHPLVFMKYKLLPWWTVAQRSPPGTWKQQKNPHSPCYNHRATTEPRGDLWLRSTNKATVLEMDVTPSNVDVSQVLPFSLRVSDPSRLFEH